MAQRAPDPARSAHLEAEVLPERQQPIRSAGRWIQEALPLDPGHGGLLSGIERFEQLIELRMGLASDIGEAVQATATQKGGEEERLRGGHGQGSAAGVETRLIEPHGNAGLLHNICG
jgi:hypothetical protein